MPIFTDGFGGDVFSAIDTHVREGSAGSNYGTATTMIACSNAGQRMNMLLKFTLTSLAGYTVNSAVLSLFNTFTYAASLNFSLYRIKAANGGWVETESNWNNKALTPSVTRWAGDTAQDGGADGGCSVAGTDYEAVAIGSFTYLANTAVNTEHPINLDAAQVQALIDGGNYGLIVICTTPNIYGNYGWATSDHATTGLRPKLVVDYSTGITGVLAATLGEIVLSAAGTVEAGAEIVGTLAATLGEIVLSATGAQGILYADGPGGNVNTAADVNLHQTAATYNGGTHDAVQFGSYNYALMRFDLSAIPAGTTILSAKLTLGLYEGGGGADVFPVLAANAGWIEGTRNLQLALAGEPCWNALAADGAGGVTTPWAGGANGCGVAGVDIGTRIGQLTAAAAGVYEVDLDLDTVRGWFGVANPGILIKPTTTSPYHIALSEYVTAGYRPKLTVLYSNDIIGGLAQTLGVITLSASGEVAVSGGLSAALDDIILTASGQVEILGAASNTLGEITLSAAGEVEIFGVANNPLGAIVLQSSGLVDVDLMSVVLALSGELHMLASIEGETHTSVAVSGDVHTLVKLEGEIL